MVPARRLNLAPEVRTATGPTVAVDTGAALVDKDTTEVKTRSVPVGSFPTAAPLSSASPALADRVRHKTVHRGAHWHPVKGW